MNPSNEIKKEYRPTLDASKTDWNSDFNTQLYSILLEISATDEQKYELEIIKDKVRQAICPIWPDVNISSYGSTLTGAWLNCSDLDFSVNSISASIDKSYLCTVIGAELAKVKEFSEFMEHEVDVPKLFVLNSIYLPTNRRFDITFNNEPSKATSALLVAIISTDDRVLHLTMLIKFWFKVHGMYGFNRISSMAVYSLVIFYLQQEGLIPSVASMLDNVNCRRLNGWNVAIKNTNISQKERGKTYLQLVGGFFEFYEKFDWQNNVVSPFSGTTHHRYDFFKNVCGRLPNIFVDYKMYVQNNNFGPKSLAVGYEKCAYIQDPLFLSENVAAYFDKKFVWYLKGKFTKAAKCYRSSLKNNGKDFLKRILVRNESNKIMNTKR